MPTSAIAHLVLPFAAVLLAACGGGGGSTNTGEEKPAPYSYTKPSALEDGWAVDDIAQHGLDRRTLEQMVDSIRARHRDVDGMVIARHGKLVFEQYFNGHSADRRHELQSATKSVDSALVGIAIGQGLLHLEDAVHQWLPDLASDWRNGKDRIDHHHLLTMTAGLDCMEQSPGACNTSSLNQSDSWSRFTLQQPMAHAPGDHYAYFTGLNIVSHTILERASGLMLADYAQQFLFAPLGIEDARWNQSPSGEALGLMLRPRDMAIFGQLYLNGGHWQGQQLIAEDWVQASTSPQVQDGDWLDEWHYGYWWWLFSPDKAGYGEPYYLARGAKGNHIAVVPGRELVVVFTGNDWDRDSQPELMRSYIFPALLD